MFDFKDKTDEEVVSCICLNNKEAYFVVVERYEARLNRYVNSIIHDDSKTKDIVQETFIKAFVNLKGFDINKKFSSWIYRIAHNEALNYIKKYKNEILFDDDFDFPSDENIIDDFEKKEILEKVNVCLNKISMLYKEPLVLYAIEDRSYEEISDILRIPMGTVATRISRAKALMKKICQRN